ncbi:MAG TPA: hypothetical protein DIW44_05595 [Anaerolineaceae bacterium]|nr:hypothetical protein [Anaerolineaceae bacterium]
MYFFACLSPDTSRHFVARVRTIRASRQLVEEGKTVLELNPTRSKLRDIKIYKSFMSKYSIH